MYYNAALLNLISVDLYTKAHTLVSDIWFYFKEHEFSLDYDSKLMESTMFADYRISQVLLHFKVLNYSEELLIRLEKNGKTPNIRLFFTNGKSFIFIRNPDLRTVHSMYENCFLIDPMLKKCH